MSGSHSNPADTPPTIPDHEMLRCIGRGAYGEVWMARTVTGVLRAVKVVRRENFEKDRTFEREFEGIRAFEPISRSHPGLISILHVGRHHSGTFYYYVMELADDRETGREVNPVEYEVKSLATEKNRIGGLPMEQVIIIGRQMAEALGHLHSQGLIHRDIKPSNIIYVEDQPQLADIGLVAQEGQRTYVGTEGFVPPEGPGTAQADVYSLGMVLYELSTGRDRLDFPALPDDPERLGDRVRWRQLNEIICQACAPRPEERYPSAVEMADELRQLEIGGVVRRARRTRRWKWFAAALVLSAAGALVWHNGWQKKGPTETRSSLADRSTTANSGPEATSTAGTGVLKITTEPEGAEVWIAGQKKGKTPLTLGGLEPGLVSYELRLAKRRPARGQWKIEPGQTVAHHEILPIYRPPERGKSWTNSLGMKFSPRGREHIARWPTEQSVFVQATNGEFIEGEVLPWKIKDNDKESEVYIVHVPESDAEVFRAWAEKKDRETGYLGPEHFYRIEKVTEGLEPRAEPTGESFLSFQLVVARHEFGEVELTSEPPGAEVWEGETKLGVTPCRLEQRPAGRLRIEYRLAGYSPRRLSGEVDADRVLKLHAPLVRNQQVVFDREWDNSLGMKFRPLNGLQYSVWETRRRDYLAYRPQKKDTAEEDQSLLCPVTNISRAEATAFCTWLTERERRDGRIGPTDTYRLPTDREWSLAAGLKTERGERPSERHLRVRGVYPWGLNWPPPAAAGNFADKSAQGLIPDSKPGFTYLDTEDGYAPVAPVGSYPANQHGLNDISGNVWEWVSEDWGTDNQNRAFARYGVVRGGSWANSDRQELMSSYRRAIPTDLRDPTIGFRVILSREEKNTR